MSLVETLEMGDMDVEMPDILAELAGMNRFYLAVSWAVMTALVAVERPEWLGVWLTVSAALLTLTAMAGLVYLGYIFLDDQLTSFQDWNDHRKARNTGGADASEV